MEPKTEYMGRYRLQNKQGRFLNAFFPNANYRKRDIFQCSQSAWTCFGSEEEAEKEKEYMLKTIRDGGWDSALVKVTSQFVKSLKVVKEIM